MKKYLIYISILGLSACSKDFLDKKPQGERVDATFYKSQDDAIAAINAAYDPLGWDFTNNAFTSEFLFGDIVSDDAVKGGENLGDQPYIQELEIFQGKPSNPSLGGVWKQCYSGIYRTNLVLDKVPAINMDEKVKARILGEAKFLRAYYYFNLVRMFGGVPLITHPLQPSEYKMGRASKEEVYAQIEKDFNEASAVLPEKDAYPKEELGRATRGAALGMLARVYLFESKWAEAYGVADKVIKSKKYALDSLYGRNFRIAGEHGIESVFEIDHMNSNDGWGNANEGTLTNILQGSRNNGFGWGFNCPTQDFVNEFEANDPRLAYTVIMENDTLNGGPADNSVSPTKMHARKYVIAPNERPTLGDINSNGPSNIRVLRYSDVLLMAAEAAVHLGDNFMARTYLNQVRKRARDLIADATIRSSALPAIKNTVSGDDLLQAIYHERRVELGLEGLRFFDIVRQGRAAQIMQKTPEGTAFRPGVNELFPIPQAEIDITGGAITQNPGY